jgi:hypothetical protein
MQSRSGHSPRGVKEVGAASIPAGDPGGTSLADDQADGPSATAERAKPGPRGAASPRVPVPSARRPSEPGPTRPSPAQPAPTETEPAPTETEPKASEPGPGPSEPGAKASEPGPKASETEPKASETEPKASETAPAPSETEPGSTEAGQTGIGPAEPGQIDGTWEDTAEAPREDDELAPPRQASSSGEGEEAGFGQLAGQDAPHAGAPPTAASGPDTPAKQETDPWADVALPDVTRHVSPVTTGTVRAARSSQPGWGRVLTTTVQLWSRRRVAPLASRVRSVVATWRFLLALTVAAAVFVAGAITVALSTRTAPASKPGPGQQASTAAGAAGGGLASATLARQQAGRWIFQQASGDAVVSCDPAMCSVLEQDGVPAGRLLTLRPGQSDPLGSDIVIATPAVRSEFGSRLASVYAPVTLAVFGSGSTRIDIRAIAPDGAAAYSGAFAADQRARKLAGQQMATNPRITVSGTARQQLMAGQVDSRLLVTLTTLAAMHPVTIKGFGSSPGTGSTPGVPLRSADLAVATTAGVLRHFFSIQRPPYHPAALNVLYNRPRRTVLRVLYPVPSPLGLLGTRS